MPVGGTSSQIKDVAETVHNQLFPAMTGLLERFAYMGHQQMEAQSGKTGPPESTWATQAFQVKAACDELTEQLRRAGAEEVGKIRLPQQIVSQPGGERYRDE